MYPKAEIFLKKTRLCDVVQPGPPPPPHDLTLTFRRWCWNDLWLNFKLSFTFDGRHVAKVGQAKIRTQRNATQRDATRRNATQRNATQRNATQRNALAPWVWALVQEAEGRLIGVPGGGAPWDAWGVQRRQPPQASLFDPLWGQ